MLKKIIGCVFCLFLPLLLVSCNLHLRKPEDFPASLRVLQLKTYNVNNAITAELKRSLHASHVSINNKHAPFMLTLHDSTMQTDMPIVFNANAASLYTYTLSVVCTLVDAHNKKIFDTIVTATESVTNNVNQTSPPVFTPLMRSTLTQNLVNNIYALLTSYTTQEAIKANQITPCPKH